MQGEARGYAQDHESPEQTHLDPDPEEAKNKHTGQPGRDPMSNPVDHIEPLEPLARGHVWRYENVYTRAKPREVTSPGPNSPCSDQVLTPSTRAPHPPVLGSFPFPRLIYATKRKGPCPYRIASEFPPKDGRVCVGGDDL